MKNTIKSIMIISIITMFLIPSFVLGQDSDDPHAVYVTKLKIAFPEDGSLAEYDSLKTLFMENVVNKNKYIVSQMRLAHWFTPDARDYFVVNEYKNLDDFEKAQDENTRLAKEWLRTMTSGKSSLTLSIAILKTGTVTISINWMQKNK